MIGELTKVNWVPMEAPLFRRSLHLIALLAACSSAHADWSYLTESAQGGDAYYIDASTIRPSGPKRFRIWILRDSSTPDQDAGGNGNFYSTKSQREYDCSQDSARITYLVGYRERMGSGEVVFSASGANRSFEPVIPGSINWRIMSQVCAR